MVPTVMEMLGHLSISETSLGLTFLDLYAQAIFGGQ